MKLEESRLQTLAQEADQNTDPGILPAEGSLFPKTLSEGRTLWIGDSPQEVGLYNKSFMKGYLDSDFDTQQALLNEALTAMLEYYLVTFDPDCFDATKALADKLLDMRDRFEQTRAALLSPATGKKRVGRGKVAFLTNLPYCFSVVSPDNKDRVRDCLTQTYLEVASAFGKDITLNRDVPAIFCGDLRFTLLGGNPSINKLWIASVTRRYCIDNAICTHHPQLAGPWEAANQAFLKRYQEPYAEDNFSSVVLNTEESRTIDAIITRHQKSSGLIQ